jgi:hypothetical protein
MFAPETIQVVRKELGDGGSICPDAHLAPAARSKIRQSAGHLVDILENAKCMLKTGMASFSQGDAIRVAVKQTGSEMGFKVRDAFARGSHCKISLLRATRNAAGARNFNKQVERDQIKPRVVHKLSP